MPWVGGETRRRMIAAVLAVGCQSTVPAFGTELPAAAAPPLAAAPFTRLDVRGARHVDAAAIRDAVGASVARDSLEAPARRLAALYTERGFFGATFDLEPAGGDTLRIRIDEGHETRLAQLFMRGSRALPETVGREILALPAGTIARPADVEARLVGLVEEYARRGYLDAEAVLERWEVGPAGVIAGIAISEGETSRLAEVQVQGNTLSRAALVERLAGLATPRAADIRQIRDAPALLRRSGLFASVEPPRIYRIQGNDVGVLLRVVEAPRRNSAFGAVGVARDPRRDRPYLTGSVELALRNLVGSGRDIDLAWKRDGLIGSRLAVAYRERFWFGLPLDLGVDLSQTERDSTSTWQTAGFAAEWPLNRNLALTAGGALDRSVFHPTIAAGGGASAGVTGNTLRWRGNVGLRFTSLGREEDGGRFGTFEVRAETAHRRNDLRSPAGADHDRVRQTIWGGRFEAGLPLALRHVIAARGEWHALTSDEAEVPVSELFEFGGARTLRGYREAQFRGDQVAYGGLEYRYGDRRVAQLYAFLDAGALRRRVRAAPRDESAHVGTGVGMRAQVATGALDVSFGIGEEHSFSSTKVHVAFQQRF